MSTNKINKINKKNKKNKNKTKKFRKLVCAPYQKYNVNDKLRKKSCYSNDNLFSLKLAWNKSNPNNLIETNNPKEIWLLLKKNLKKKCNNEACWLKNMNLDNTEDIEKIKKKLFRPFSPKTWNLKPYEWLSSVDIENVMKQFVKSKKNFIFFGASPIDFDLRSPDFNGKCVYESLCNLNIIKLYNSNPRKDKIGIIFNLDPHTKGGSHWVAMFINLVEDYIFYFDSNGDKIKKEINILKKRIINQAKYLNKDLRFIENKLEHQLKDGQCGIYCLYFIIELLQGRKKPEDFKKRIPDELMRDYRIKYFNAS